MKSIKNTLRLALLAGLAWPAAQAMANTSTSFCAFTPRAGAQQKVYVRDMGTLYVPRDATLSTVIGPSASLHDTPDLNHLSLDCEAYGDRMEFDFRATHGIAPPIPPVDGQDRNGFILKTNVPGVGAIVQVLSPFRGSDTEWIPIGSNPPFIPFTAYHERVRLAGPQLLGLRHYMTLVKIGDLPPGIHQVDGQLFTGHLNWNGMGQVVDFTLKATIIQSQCSLIGDPISANPVQLGEWSIDDFTGPGFTTPAVPFSIRLNNCQTDPNPSNLTQATIELEGIDGSAPIGPGNEHVFSLTHDSDARGMGIQMLYNSQPMPLNTELPLVTLVNGDMLLNFQARFYQVEPSNAVGAGVAKGALNFTLRYR